MSDELTQKIPPDDEVKTTQPSITAVFELIQDVKRVVDSNAARLSDIESQVQSSAARLSDIESQVQSSAARLNDIESQVESVKRAVDSNAARLNEIEAQMKSGFSTLGYKIDALNRGRLQSEADYFSLLHRVEELESKAS
jgi:methyl-accepting chemotaxis protein